MNKKFKENNEISISSDDYLEKDRIKIVNRNTELRVENPKVTTLTYVNAESNQSSPNLKYQYEMRLKIQTH